ncbi:hypothetical protein [Cardinium endosymbiont of Oedothorax gibbosus]|uniref:hypothetical protein n=1 Tax=Cardinium endosymbiont of Oedothorax gibbosus TaxID=931101 RepID=UPI0020240F58|nr:hypothetical protein [Cardinium endosymbiont of Oedothorax gibbosus]
MQKFSKSAALKLENQHLPCIPNQPDFLIIFVNTFLVATFYKARFSIFSQHCHEAERRVHCSTNGITLKLTPLVKEIQIYV